MIQMCLDFQIGTRFLNIIQDLLAIYILYNFNDGSSLYWQILTYLQYTKVHQSSEKQIFSALQFLEACSVIKYSSPTFTEEVYDSCSDSDILLVVLLAEMHVREGRSHSCVYILYVYTR